MGIRDWLLELLFPSRCAFCGRLTGPGQEVCGDCAGALPRVPDGQVLRRAGTTTAPWRFTTTDLSGRASWA